MNANDVRINNTLASPNATTSNSTSGYAFITDESTNSSILSIDLSTGAVIRRLFNTSVVRADEKYVGSFDGELIYCWNKTEIGYCTTGADGIALASGNFYGGVLASRRFYYIPQAVMIDPSLSDDEVLAAVRFPSQCATEQAGFTADDRGRVYILASEQNAIYYVDSLQSEVEMTVNGVPPGGSGLVPPERYVVHTLVSRHSLRSDEAISCSCGLVLMWLRQVRSGMIQHADSAAILDGYLYFNTNQLQLSPDRQYNNTDNRKGPFRSYRVWIGREPAV